ncbi:MAG: PAS domain S-box protein [Leptolyngbyaceae bacterium]|nr:PAS domain S-box protein [Leptolyngbyaceae bacterium]
MLEHCLLSWNWDAPKPHNFIDGLSESACLIRGASQINYANQSMLDLLGYSRGEIQGTCLLTLMDRAAHATLQQAQQKSQDGLPERFECQFRRKDGSVIEVRVSISPILGQTGEWLGSMVMLIDITEQKRMEAEYAQLIAYKHKAQEEAATVKHLTETLMHLSYELRSPLQLMLGWASLLRQHELDQSTTAQALATIERHAKAQAKIIQGIHDIPELARLNSNSLHF